MSDKNQRAFVLENQQRVKSPILELGSRQCGGTSQSNFRKDFPKKSYIGTDLEAGEDVDVVCDFTNTAEVRDRLGVGSFRTAICLSVMEHCWQPFRMAENLYQVLAPGGVLLLSVPFVWRQHGFPDDYWRFTPSAIRVLFPAFTVVEDASYCTTKLYRKKFPLSEPSLSPPKPEGTTHSFYPMLLNMVLVKT